MAHPYHSTRDVRACIVHDMPQMLHACIQQAKPEEAPKTTGHAQSQPSCSEQQNVLPSHKTPASHKGALELGGWKGATNHIITPMANRRP